jgi:radical SAM enzyme (TIGR01210 family)
VTPLHSTAYPEAPAERDRWIIERRGPREPVEADKPYAFLVEEERFEKGEIGGVATIFLTNRECPWRCAMCDLWRNTVTETVPLGAIPAQITYALDRLPGARQIKLYNSGSFFDRGAIPREDYAAIASAISTFERVIVECHPSLIGDSYDQFRRLCIPPLEVAMGLETAHPEVLAKLNKRMTLDQYAEAAHRLQSDGVGLRSFVLVQPPFMRGEEALEWTCKSLDFAFDCGATVVSLLPTRAGNGAVDAFATMGLFAPPDLRVVEAALDYGVALGRGRVFLDLWDIDRVACCPDCRLVRIERLRRMNFSQRVLEYVHCETCGGRS